MWGLILQWEAQPVQRSSKFAKISQIPSPSEFPPKLRFFLECDASHPDCSLFAFKLEFILIYKDIYQKLSVKAVIPQIFLQGARNLFKGMAWYEIKVFNP